MDVMLAAFARGSVGGLTSLPQVLLALLEQYDDRRASPGRLARVVAMDPALSAKVIALDAITSGRVRGGRCITLQQAVEAVGVDAVRSMALGANGYQVLLRHDSGWHTHLYRLWLRAITCAHVAELLAILADYPAPTEAYLAGLFHNLGQLVLSAYAPEQYPNLLSVAQDGPKLGQLEISHFNTVHYDVGADLIDSWRLESFIADAVRYQAESADALCDAHPLVRILNLARGLSTTDDDRGAAIETAAKLFPHVQPARLRALAHNAVERVAEDARTLDISLGDGDRLADVEAKSAELSGRIRSIALLDGVSRTVAAAHDAKRVPDALRRGADILAGVDACQLMIYQPMRDTLELIGSGLGGDLRLPVRDGGSLPARALASGRVLQTDDARAEDTLVVADRQLLGLLHTEVMLCVPLGDGDVKTGVMIIGLSHADLPYSHERTGLLRQFGRRAAAAIAAANQPAEPTNTVAVGLEQHVQKSVHEARNPLTTVKNYVRILTSKHAGEEWAERDLTIIGQEIERVDGILGRLADISHAPASAPGAVAINRVIADIVWLLQTSMLDERNIRVRLDLGRDIPLLAIGSDQFKQIVTNLVNNAADAMPNGGEIDIGTRAGVNANGRMYAEMTVTDSGPGIAAKLLDALFDRGTSTKQGEGHGFGLSIVSELVEEHAGSISCRSEVGAGATFQILLPYHALDDGAVGRTDDQGATKPDGEGDDTNPAG